MVNLEHFIKKSITDEHISYSTHADKKKFFVLNNSLKRELILSIDRQEVSLNPAQCLELSTLLVDFSDNLGNYFNMHKSTKEEFEDELKNLIFYCISASNFSVNISHNKERIDLLLENFQNKWSPK